MRTIESELKACQLTWAEAKKAAKDRPKWRTVVEALCSSRGLKDMGREGSDVISICQIMMSICQIFMLTLQILMSILQILVL